MAAPNQLERLAATRHPSTLDIAWAAGLYEGEGYTTVLKSKKNGYAGQTQQVVIAQKQRQILDWCKELFGGSVYTVSNHECPHFRWSITGARARGFLMTMYKFLSDRRKEQAKAVLFPVGR